jgi:pyruvate dehydrogenase E2 component (dihydrolipoamide acetyltransferase)
MPKVRALAADLGVKLDDVVGTGSDGVITAEDVRRSADTIGVGTSRGPMVLESRELSAVGKAMAAAVTRSWEAPQFVQQVLIDAEPMLRRRRAADDRFSVTDYLIDALVQAVLAVPEANSAFSASRLTLYRDINVSVATATDRGLLLPVLHRAQLNDLPARSVLLKKAIENARSGRLSPDEVSGGTISLSNIGMFRVDSGTPLLTPNQTTLVFAASLARRPAIKSLSGKPSRYR